MHMCDIAILGQEGERPTSHEQDDFLKHCTQLSQI